MFQGLVYGNVFLRGICLGKFKANIKDWPDFHLTVHYLLLCHVWDVACLQMIFGSRDEQKYSNSGIGCFLLLLPELYEGFFFVGLVSLIGTILGYKSLKKKARIVAFVHSSSQK